MKKGKVFGKSQIALAVMVVALAGAVWLNMRYSAENSEAANNTSSKYLGTASYVNGEAEGEKQEVSDPVAVYFNRLRSDRLKARDDAYALIEEALENADVSEENKKTALDTAAALALRTEKEAAIETLLHAKGFSSAVAVIGDEDINIIVESDGLKAAEAVQIQDAVLSQTDFSAAKIKIVTMSKAEIEKALK